MAEQNTLTASSKADAAAKAAFTLGLEPAEQANAIGRNILHHELGDFGTWDGPRYSLDNETRDRLLAHARQDTAAALILAAKAFSEAENACRINKHNRLLLLCLVLLMALALLVVPLWS